MKLTLKNIIDIINKIAPFDLAENWDNSGLQAGNPDWAIEKIMISLDVSMEVMEAAKNWGADLVLTHHPLFINPENSIDFRVMPGSAIAMAAREKISILSAHTNLDKAPGGLNDYFAGIIGIECLESFYTDPDSQIKDSQSQESQTQESRQVPRGIGRLGQLNPELSLRDLSFQIKERLGLEHIRVTGDLNLMIKKVALCTGSGGSLTDVFLRSPADVYITGDVKYHEARKIETLYKGLIDVGHFASEIIVVDLLTNLLQQALPLKEYDIRIKGFKKEKDPFKIV
jgi:dinuclear metal center YbgI/SA1388 family protein